MVFRSRRLRYIPKDIVRDSNAIEFESEFEKEGKERKNRMGFLIFIINATGSCSVIGGMGWDVG